MKRFALALVCVLAIACSNDSSTTTPGPAPAPQPAPLAQPNIVNASNVVSFTCQTGLCVSLTFPVINIGAGCGTNTNVVVRAYGSDGNGIQLGVDIPMGLPGSSLSTFIFRPGTTETLQNLGPFNDVRSAHTVFKSFITSKAVAC